MLGRPGGDAGEDRVGRQRRYCFHHDGAFEIVLRVPGFAVERRFGQAWGRENPPLNHLALVVTIEGHH